MIPFLINIWSTRVSNQSEYTMRMKLSGDLEGEALVGFQ
jgi:hypothetical protein